MIATLALSLALWAQAGASPAPLVPRIERVECTSVDTTAGVPLFRADVLLRNVSDSGLVAWTVRWHDSAQPDRWVTTFQDGVLSPSDRWISPGATVVSRWNVACDMTPEVVAAVYSDGSFVGNTKAIDALRFRRGGLLRGVQTILSVLRTTPLGDSAVDSVQSVDGLVSQISGPDVINGSRALLSALSADPRTNHMFSVGGPRRVVAKAVLVSVIERAERDLQDSLQIIEKR